MKIDFYQTIPELGIKGRFNTPEEFDKIGLPKNLTGWNVLDIGCNTGAFLIECIKRKSWLADGIEINIDWRILGQGVVAELGLDDEIGIFMSFNEYANATESEDIYKRDLVLLLSVLHVTKNPQELLDDAWKITKKLLIVEINDRLQKIPIKLPKEAKLYGKNKDNRSVYHIIKNN